MEPAGFPHVPGKKRRMKVINFAETNSVLNQYMAEIRDVQVQSDRMRFRRNIERIGEIMAYEMSKELTYSEKQVQTPLGIAPVSTFDDDVVIATVFRAGLPLHAGFLNVFDRAGNAFVSAYRYYKDKECRTESGGRILRLRDVANLRGIRRRARHA